MIALEVKHLGDSESSSLKTFSSYSFDRNLLSPASPFRFTAEGVDYDLIQSIRSGDTAELWYEHENGDREQVCTGFIDETDAHTTATTDEFVITGRDTLAQLVDNVAIDAQNKIIHLDNTTLENLTLTLIEGTRLTQELNNYGCPTGNILFRTNPGETKISALQRYLEYTNCLVWTDPDGTLSIGKPDMAQDSSGYLTMMRSNPRNNNVLDIRSRRNVNAAIRQIAVQLQALNIVDPTSATVLNNDPDVTEAVGYDLVGKSVYRTFAIGNGDEAVNNLSHVGTQGTPQDMGRTLARREIARSNMQVLEVECVVQGHLNENGQIYNVNQVYSVQYEKDGVDEDMYVYAVRYDLTASHGMLTTLKLCRLGTIVGDVPIKVVG